MGEDVEELGFVDMTILPPGDNETVSHGTKSCAVATRSRERQWNRLRVGCDRKSDCFWLSEPNAKHVPA